MDAKRGAESQALLVGLLFAVGNHIPTLGEPAAASATQMENRAVMTICNINLIGLTVSPGFLPRPLPRYL